MHEFGLGKINFKKMKLKTLQKTLRKTYLKPLQLKYCCTKLVYKSNAELHLCPVLRSPEPDTAFLIHLTRDRIA